MKKPKKSKNSKINLLKENVIIDCKPFLKWVGGKKQLLPAILKRIPKFKGRYFEPFIGGGAVLFATQPKKAFISDINPELINTYKVIKEDVDALIKDLKKHRYNSEYFYKIRNADRSRNYKNWSAVRKASRLIFLNKTCYNGLYRVNSAGQFNTPFGRYTNPKILDEVNLRACSKALQKVNIQLASFEKLAKKVKSGDFVYMDPPYVPLSITSSFTSYNKDGFGLELQKKLYDLCCNLDKKGVRFLLSNSSAPFILDLYKNFKIELIPAKRSINSKSSKRGKVNEVLVSNF